MYEVWRDFRTHRAGYRRVAWPNGAVARTSNSTPGSRSWEAYSNPFAAPRESARHPSRSTAGIARCASRTVLIRDSFLAPDLTPVERRAGLAVFAADAFEFLVRLLDRRVVLNPLFLPPANDIPPAI